MAVKKRKKVPPTFDMSYPLVPLEDEERMPIEEGGGGSLSRFRTRMHSVDIFDHYLPDLASIAERIYFKGGKLSSYGLIPKEGLDETVAFDVLCAMLVSPFPNHIQKEATVGLALYNWYEPGVRDDQLEPSFPVFFKVPIRNKANYHLLVGKNRN